MVASDARHEGPRRVLGDFRIRRELGRGGMGVVHLARQLSLGRDVALKILDPAAAADPTRLLRFQREAALLARLSHPHIVQIHVVGEARGPDGPVHFIAMEWIDGTDLERAFAARAATPPGDGNAALVPDARAILCIAAEVARALGAAHRAGIVHRDVKPSNVLVDRSGHAHLADFGIARDVGADALTRTGALAGTPYYLAPELQQGGRPTPAADVWSLGALLYEGLTGARAFDGGSPAEVAHKTVMDDPVPPRARDASIPRDVETIVLHCLEKDPARRYADGDALADDLERALRGEPIAITPVSAATRMLRRARRRRTPLYVSVAITVLGAAALTWGWLESGARRTREAQAFAAELADAQGKDDLDAVRALLDQAIARDEHDDARLFLRADLALRQRRWADAEHDFARIVEHGTTTAGDADVAAAALGRALAGAIAANATPDPPPVRDAATTGSARAAFYIAMIHQARREMAEALRSAEHAVELDPDFPEARYSLAALRFRTGDYRGAEREFLAYQRARPLHADTYNFLGQIDYSNRDFDAAVVNFKRCLERNAGQPTVWNGLAAAYMFRSERRAQKNDMEGAESDHTLAREALDEARKLAPDYFLIDFNDALLHVMENDTDAALKSFQAAIQRGGADPYWGRQMWLSFGDSLIAYRQYDAARAILGAAAVHGLEGDPDLLMLRERLSAHDGDDEHGE